MFCIVCRFRLCFNVIVNSGFVRIILLYQRTNFVNNSNNSSSMQGQWWPHTEYVNSLFKLCYLVLIITANNIHVCVSN